MTVLLFPDTTVLINFVAMERVDLFDELVAGRGRWTVTIAGECARSALEVGQEGLVVMSGILGQPLIPTPAERIDTATYRTQLASPGDDPKKHLGEAETLAVITGQALNAVFVTDDHSAAALVQAVTGRPCYSTTDLLKLAVRTSRLSADAAWALIGILKSNGRHPRGVPTSFDAFQKWCA